MIASQAANFLTITNSSELRKDFEPIFKPLIKNFLDMPPLGHAVLFTDNSILLAFDHQGTKHLLTTTIEDGPEQLIEWATEHGRLEDMFTAFSHLLPLESTNAAQ